MAEYSEGICGDGAAILKDGNALRVHEIVAELNEMQYALDDIWICANSGYNLKDLIAKIAMYCETSPANSGQCATT